MGLFAKICTLVISVCDKNFLTQRSNRTTKVCLVLYESFISKTGPKFNCLTDFFATSLLTMQAHTHAHCCSLLKLDLVIDRREDFNCLMKLKGV